MADFGFDTFLSPMTWRYGTPEMKNVWSEESKRKMLRKIWVALAEVQSEAGLVSQSQLDELSAHADDIDIERSLEIESAIHHDLMAEIRTYAEQCPQAGGVIHLGCTSMDIEDNMDALRLRDALDIVKAKLRRVLEVFSQRIRETSDIRCMAFTHIQSAEPTTVGYRLSQTAQDLLASLEGLQSIIIKGKGFKGAVGTGASFETLLEGSGWDFDRFESAVMDRLGIPAFDVATQVYTRRQDVEVLQSLSLLCCSIHKFALDFRILQGSSVGEVNEFFSEKQVGSSAMPFKRNPINSEKICSLCRLVRSYELDAWDNASLCILERTLDDSANRRVCLPEAFIAVDEILETMIRLVGRMIVNRGPIERNFDKFGVFAASERLLMKLGMLGGDRQLFHEVIREESLKAWEAVKEGRTNPLSDLLASNAEIAEFMSPSEVRACLDAGEYVGIAPKRAILVADQIDSALGDKR
ncbi:MAG: adenylosuccinate lyase [Sphaerochaetaceae bacterium]|nr:adenylosuccinate lyase [Sphaerochaetaceae bacterium]NLY07190.1 adenylosuccinate lyase [Spirochaetales bacterium]